MEGTKTVEMKAMEALEEIRKLVLRSKQDGFPLDDVEDVLFNYDRFVAVNKSLTVRAPSGDSGEV